MNRYIDESIDRGRWREREREILFSKSGFLNPGIIDIGGWLILIVEGCPVYCRMFNSTPDLYILDGSLPHLPKLNN